MFVCVWREKRGGVVYISLMCGAVLCEVLASLTDKQMLILALRRLINIDLGG